MNFNLQGEGCIEVEGVIVPVFEDGTLECLCEDVKDTINIFKEKGRFKGTKGEIYTFTKTSKDLMKEVILVGLGKKENLDGEDIRKVYSKALRKAKELKLTALGVKFFTIEGLCVKRVLKGIVEGMALGDYDFNKYKNSKEQCPIKDITIMGIGKQDIEAVNNALEESLALVEATILARNLVNEPANIIYPETLAKEAKKAGESHNFQVEVFDEKEIEALGMKAFLSVARGSVNSPRLIVMRYMGNEDNKEDILGLVGKGLTYDSGGYSLKPTDGMVTMKSDMGGAAAVIGAMCAIADMNLKANVIAVVAACENMISGGAYKPGDIISTMAGKSIEVANTDAEGRLTLADAVYYAIDKEKVSKVVDIATLTGAVLVALGTTTTGVVTNNDEFYNVLQKASDISGEKIWKLPAFDEYRELIKSDVADLKNVGGRMAGTVTAGLFIEEFIKDKKPWLHLDIAGTSWSDSDKNYLSKGATGVGVRTLYYLVRENGKIQKECGCQDK